MTAVELDNDDGRNRSRNSINIGAGKDGTGRALVGVLNPRFSTPMTLEW